VGERAKTWFAGLLLAAVIVSVLIDQATGGKYPVPALLVDLAKIVIPALFVADGLQEASRVLSSRRNRQDPPPEEGNP
jgi:hypothetical protein